MSKLLTNGRPPAHPFQRSPVALNSIEKSVHMHKVIPQGFGKFEIHTYVVSTCGLYVGVCVCVRGTEAGKAGNGVLWPRTMLTARENLLPP